jgi:excisionase family DNA binding protein
MKRLRGGDGAVLSPASSAPSVYSRPAETLDFVCINPGERRKTMPELPDVRFLTVAEVADLMRVSKMTVYRLVHSGELPAVRFGRSYRVPESAVTEALHRPIADVG